MAVPGLADAAVIINTVQQLRDGTITHGLVASGSYYAGQIMPTDLLDAPSHGYMGKRRSDWASSATHCTTTFDDLDNPSVYSMSTAPPRRGPEPQHHQRPAVPEPMYSWPQSWSVLNGEGVGPDLKMSSVGLPCEFRNLSGCLREYSFDQVEQWIRHIKDDHLGHRFPGESRCWFCDEQFVARSNRREDKSLAFHMRMYHIAGHLEIGLTAADIRPDFPLLDHLKEYSIIDEETFAWAKNQSEQMPRPRGMTLVSPSGMPPRGEIYPEDRRSRYHRPNGVVRRRRDRDAN